MPLLASCFAVLAPLVAGADAPSPAQLESLNNVVRSYVDRDETVSAELMVLVGDEVVLHSVHGDADRASKRPLALDSIHCIRSMTKPVVGTAIQMLIDDGKLGLDDPVAKWIPEFNHDRHAAITVRQLLEHSSGLPLSSLLTHDLAAVRSTEEIAGFAARAPLAFDPGTGFNYSDDGVDTLAVIVGKVSGMAPEAFIKARILEPLGMKDTYCLVPDQRERFVTGYLGSAGNWTKFWAREDKPVFPCFLGSQGMYSTCADYAKLLSLWAHDGRVGDRRLLSHAAIERGLTPAREMGYPTGFDGARTRYGELWTTWVKSSTDGAAPKVLAFGHSGSDGTAAWHWPERDLTVLYFTQSRGGITALSIEREIDQHLLGGKKSLEVDPRTLAGFFWDQGRQRYAALSAVNGKLTIDIPARFSGTLVPTSDEDRWTFELDPSASVRFERDESKAVRAIRLDASGATTRWDRLAHDPTLPSAAEVVALVTKAHGFADGGAPFPVVRQGTIDVPKLKRHLQIRQEYDGLRSRIETKIAEGPAQVTVSDGTSTWTKVGDAPVQQLADLLAEQSRLEHPGRVFGDWTKYYREVKVIARVDEGGSERLLVRCVPTFAPPTCFIVDEASGRVLGLERMVTIPNLGTVGAVTRLDDFRAVSANGASVTMSFHATTEFANPLLGVSETKVTSAETPERIEPSRFKLD